MLVARIGKSLWGGVGVGEVRRERGNTSRPYSNTGKYGGQKPWGLVGGWG